MKRCEMVAASGLILVFGGFVIAAVYFLCSEARVNGIAFLLVMSSLFPWSPLHPLPSGRVC